MENTELTCVLCGGTEFTKESGYYYCDECQTQSQELREHVFQAETEAEVLPTTSQRPRGKRIRSKKKDLDQLTSWECYNYIIFGLVNELIEIGAKSTLKEVLRILWFKYLHKLEVLGSTLESTPKLGACHSKIDAEIIYGKSLKRKRVRSRTPSPSVSDVTNDSTSIRKQHTKSKRSLILANYDEFSSQLKAEESSLHNQSLTSLGASSDSPSRRQSRLLFSKAATKEILKSMSKNHLKQHCKDFNSLLGCHNLSYRKLSQTYIRSPEVLSRQKIYSLIYLGLLINKDKIQLGDMLRFIREGYLSYYNVSHFFPEEYQSGNFNIKSWNHKNMLLTHSGVRITAAKIAKYIEVVKYISRQNLIELCQRYSKELNLPDEVWGFTLNLMSRVPPKMHFTEHSTEIPNYEGRVLSMILFTIKLMFGLDGCTEGYFSKFAERINVQKNEKMFVWRDWEHYIIYRKLVLMHHHFPTQHIYKNDYIQGCDEFLNFITEQDSKYPKEADGSNHISEVLKGLLEKLKSKQAERKTELIFVPSLNPFQDYTRLLLNSKIPEEHNYLINVLESDFKHCSLDFLTNPYVYLDQLHINERIGTKHRGANKHLILTEIENTKKDRANWRIAANKKHTVNLGKTFAELEPINKVSSSNLDSKTLLKQFESYHMQEYRKRMSLMAKKYNLQRKFEVQTNGLHDDTNFIESMCSTESSQNEVGETNTHYNPHDRFWLRSQNTCTINKDQFMEFFNKFPNSFKLIFNECARIAEVDLKEFFEEYNNVEIYLCYCNEYAINEKKKQTEYDNVEINKLIKRAIKKWFFKVCILNITMIRKPLPPTETAKEADELTPTLLIFPIKSIIIHNLYLFLENFFCIDI